MRSSTQSFRRPVFRTAIQGVVLFLSWSLPALAGQQQAVEQKVGAQTYPLIRSDVSPPLKEIAPIPPNFQEEAQPVRRWPHFHAPRPLTVTDTVLQAESGPLVGVTAGLNFDGVGRGNYSVIAAPPDTVGAVGSTQYVQWVNLAFGVFDKSTGAMIYGPANGNTLWQGFGGHCETDNNGDPIVMYDQAANRWILTQFAVGAQPYLQCIAVSTTSDATGTYRRFAYSFGNQFNDYPKGGVWPDAYYVTFNMFLNGQTFSGARACAFDRNQMLTPNGTPAPMQCFQLSSSFGGLLPSDLDGSTPPPAGAPNYHLAFDDVQQNGLNLWKFHVDWASSANSTFTGPTKIPGATFTEPCGGILTCIPQPGTTQKLDSLGDRLMYRLGYRNFGTHESLVVNHSVDVSGVTGVRWYEVRNPGGAPTVYQQGTYAPDSTHRWMGSIAQDRDGNMLLGYSASSTAVQPSIRYTGRLAADSLGTLQAESEMFTGSGSQLASLNRWGDYSAMTIDPVDDCTFWYTTEYLQTNGTFNWSTRVASFKFPSCGNQSPDFSVSASPGSLVVQQGGSRTSTITVTSVNGFSSAVTLSALGLPNGITASFSSNPVTPPANGSASSTLTLTALPAAATGTFNITIQGSAPNSTNRTTTLTLTVTSVGDAVFDPTLKAPRCSAVGNVCDSNTLLNGRDGKGAEPNQPNTINGSCADGTAGTFHFDESNDRVKVSTLDGSAFAPGKIVKVEATLWAWTGFTSDKLDLYFAANANSPTWTFITTLTPTAAGAQTLSATYALPSGSLQAVRARFRYLGSATPCATGSYDDHDDLIFAVSAGPGDTTPPTTSITAPANGATVTGVVNVAASASDNVGVTKVEFYVDGALKATDTTDPYGFGWDTTTYANGSHSLFSKAYDAASNVGTSGTVTVTVSNASGVATYDATLKAPKCGTVGNVCDSSTLLNGRDGKGAEPNQPNTINNSCADGTTGTFHFDESNDRIKVSTLDGSSFAPGKMVKIEAAVWAWTGFTSDKLDLYFAANANSPTWTFITTLTPTAAGAQTLSATYVLPSGSLQAVRARFRYLGSAAACGVGSYNDHDDLIFAVGGQQAPASLSTTSVKE